MLAWMLCHHHCGYLVHTGLRRMVMAALLMLLLGVATCVCVGAGSSPVSLTQMVVVVASPCRRVQVFVRMCIHGTVGRSLQL